MKKRAGFIVTLRNFAAVVLAAGFGSMTGLCLADEAVNRPAAPTRAQAVDETFDAMRKILPGKWRGENAHGTADNPTSDWEPVTIEYAITAGGTALIENYTDDSGQPYMTTVYHVDNNDLRATHFCGARNHPRMIARTVESERNFVSFDFVDVSNLESPDSYHSRGLDLQIIGEHSIVLTFSGLQGGKENSRVFKLQKENE